MKKEQIIKSHHGKKSVKHLAYEVTVRKEYSYTPLYLPWHLTKTHENGQPDGYLHEHTKTTLDAKVATKRQDAIRCGIEVTFEGKQFFIEQVDTDSVSPFVRVVATSYVQEHKPRIIQS